MKKASCFAEKAADRDGGVVRRVQYEGRSKEFPRTRQEIRPPPEMWSRMNFFEQVREKGKGVAGSEFGVESSQPLK